MLNKIRLEDFVEIDSGYAFKSSLFNDDSKGIPIIRIRDVNSGMSNTYYSGEYDDKYIVNNGDLLISMDGSFVITEWNGGKALLNQRVCRIKSKSDKLTNKYIHRVLPLELKLIEDKTPFVTVKHLSIRDINNIELNIPSIEIQNKIAKIIDKAQELIDKRTEQIEELDKLVKSRFIEMFGDPVSNLKCWNKDTIGSVVKSITAGWSANGEAREKREGEKAVLKVSAVTQGYFKADEYKVIGDDVGIKKYVFPEKGDLLFSRANTREMVGATCIIHKNYPDLLLPDKLWKVFFVDRVNVFYMKYILSEPSIRAEFSARSTGTSGSMYNVSMDKFKNIEIPVPPIELQNQFADFVKQVDKLKFEMEKSLKELEDNFNSLMQKAFNGELFN